MMRLTKVICTMGPASNNEAGIRGLAQRGMNIARLNFSHGSHESQTEVVHNIKRVNEADGRNVGLLLDTKGPEIRTGDVTEPIQIKAGETVVFSHKGTDAKLPVIAVNYAEFWKDVKDAEYILVDNGDMIFDPKEVTEDRVVAVARGSGSIGSRRHVNLPGGDVSLPSISEKDWADIELACKEKMDYIALSFIRKGSEIDEVRAFTTKHGHGGIKLIAKIENAVGVRNIEGIVEACDGVMIARGDLGAEIPPEDVPGVQDDLVAMCRKAGKPVIVATHMLESMIKNPMPTRAEVTDIAYAAKIGTDSTMLSGETAAGKYPFESLEMMTRTLVATEKRLERDTSSPVVKQAAKDKAVAIIVRSNDGKAAHTLSMLRAGVPVIAVTNDNAQARGMQILFGVYPIVADDSMDAVDAVRASKLLANGTTVIVTDGSSAETVTL